MFPSQPAPRNPQSNAELYQMIGAPYQGPFWEYLNRPLQPRAIDTIENKMTGYESTPVGIGKVALSFLQGVRERRIADFLENERNNQTGLDRYRDFIASTVRNPKLTPVGANEIEQMGNTAMLEHMKYELRDADQKGIGGAINKVLTTMSGGKIKTREPIDWDHHTGVAQRMLAEGSPYLKQTWIDKANEILASKIEGMQGYAPAEEIAGTAQKIANELNLGQHLGDAGAQQWVANSIVGATPRDQYTGALVQRKIYGRIAGMLGMPTPATSAPPAVRPADSVTEAPPVRTDDLGRQVVNDAAGLPMVYQGIADVDRSAYNAPLRYDQFGRLTVPSTARHRQPMPPSAPVAPAPGGQAALPNGQTAAVAPNGEVNIEAENLLQDATYGALGYKFDKPTTLFNTSDPSQPPVPNVIWNSLGRYWMDTNYQRLADKYQRSPWVPENQVHFAPRDREQDFDFYDPKTKRYVSIRHRLDEKNIYWPVAVNGVTPNTTGLELVGPSQIAVVAGTPGTYMPRAQAFGQGQPAPAVNPAIARRDWISEHARRLIGSAAAAGVTDVAALRTWIGQAQIFGPDGQPHPDAELIKGQAMGLAGRAQTNEVLEMMRELGITRQQQQGPVGEVTFPLYTTPRVVPGTEPPPEAEAEAAPEEEAAPQEEPPAAAGGTEVPPIARSGAPSSAADRKKRAAAWEAARKKREQKK